MKKVTVGVPKGRLFDDAVDLFLKAGLIKEKFYEDSRKLVIADVGSGIDFLLLRAKDVITYVLEGIADVGIVGYDLLVEHTPDVISLLDLGFGYCKVVVAGREYAKLNSVTTVKVATKFPNIARSYFRAREIEPRIVELYGSVELASITGLSDLIVDITSTGATLRENNLVIIDEILESTSRLVVNKKSFYFKRKEIAYIASRLKDVLKC
ncbi:MAG: ATP phosphoribosyltransferase [Brevinematia bacterium]